MPTPRLGLAACIVAEKIYVIGGYQQASKPGLDTVEEYDPASDSWVTRASMPTARRWLACGVVDGKIYAVGGFPTEGEPAIPTVEEYDPVSDGWASKASMLTARKGLTVSVVDGKIYAIGGADADEHLLASVEMYDPEADAWTYKAPMSRERAVLPSSTISGKIYAVGGPGPGQPGSSSLEEYGPAADTWTEKKVMPTGRASLSASAVNGWIYAIGGSSGFTALASVESYDPESDAWSAWKSIGFVDEVNDGARWAHAASVANGRIYVFGGALSPAMPPHPATNRVQEYTPSVVTSTDNDATGPDAPEGTELLQNYLNPFSYSTDIDIALPKPEYIRLTVLDLLGRPVRVLADGYRRAGNHRRTFYARDLPSGSYFVRLITSKGEATGSMQIVR